MLRQIQTYQQLRAVGIRFIVNETNENERIFEMTKIKFYDSQYIKLREELLMN